MSERGFSSPAPASGLVQRLFGIDPRALAALRISLALIILADLALRTSHFEALQTDAGVLPGWMIPDDSRFAIAPLHLLSGAHWYQATLFAIAAVFAVLMLVGCFTRIATLASWLLLLSLHTRVQFFVDFGDTILRVLMFWSVFLPLGLRWSVDAWRRPPSAELARRPVVSVGGAGLMLQIAAIYFFTALLKNGDDWRVDGTAIQFTLLRDWSLRPAGAFLLRELEWVLKPLSFGTLALEFFGPLLLFSPVATGGIRIFTVAAFVILQAGLGISMVLGLMPFTNSVMMFIFLPPAWWDALVSLPGIDGLRERFTARARAPAEGAEQASRAPAWLRRGVGITAGVCLAYVLAYNVAGVLPAVSFPGSLKRFGHFLRINQKWAMFSPNAPRHDGWFVIPARLADGSVVNLGATGPALSFAKPPSLQALHESRRWEIFQLRISLNEIGGLERFHYRERFAGYLCRRWNDAHDGDQQAVTLEVIFVAERTPEDFSPSDPKPRLLVRHQCAAPFPTEPPTESPTGA